MKQSFKKNGLLVCLFLLSACNEVAPNYTDSGNPERLLDASTEKVTFSLAAKNAVTKFSKVIAESRPSSAELRCSISNTRCAQAKEILERNSVPINLTSTNSNSVLVSYEKVIARDCNPRYVDNMNNAHHSTNHPAFGCAVAANALQMVSNKHQFTNPNLLDFPDAEKSSQNYSNYLKPSSQREVKDAEWKTSTK